MNTSDDGKNSKDTKDKSPSMENLTEQEDQQLRERLSTLSNDEPEKDWSHEQNTNQEQPANDGPTNDGIEEAFLALIQSEENKTGSYFASSQNPSDLSLEDENAPQAQDAIDTQPENKQQNTFEEPFNLSNTNLERSEVQVPKLKIKSHTTLSSSLAQATQENFTQNDQTFADLASDNQTHTHETHTHTHETETETDFSSENNTNTNLGAGYDPNEAQAHFDQEQAGYDQAGFDNESQDPNHEADETTISLPQSLDKDFAEDDFHEKYQTEDTSVNRLKGLETREEQDDLTQDLANLPADFNDETHISETDAEKVLRDLQQSAIKELQIQNKSLPRLSYQDDNKQQITPTHDFLTNHATPSLQSQSLVPSLQSPTDSNLKVERRDETYTSPKLSSSQSQARAQYDNVSKSYADPEFQALVQWSQSDVDPSPQNKPDDIPNFLSQKQETGSKFNIKTSLLTAIIIMAVLGMFYVGYKAGQGNQQGFDITSNTDNPASPTEAKDAGQEALSASRRENDPQGATEQDLPVQKQAALEETPSEAEAQPDQQPQVSSFEENTGIEPQILEFVVEDLSGTAGKNIPMNIRLVGTNLSLETMLLFRGIPEQLSLTSGVKREGVWSVAASQLNNLALTVPENFNGKFNFEVFAFPNRDTKPERRLASVNVDALPRPAPQPVQNNQTAKSEILSEYNNDSNQEQQVAAIDTNPRISIEPNSQISSEQTTTPEQPQEPTNSTRRISRSLEASMLRRANNLLRDGDVAGARLLFEHLATQGSKHAAFALGRTYDKVFLDQIFVLGLEPDHESAAKWYREAVKLGHNDAATRLSQLESQ